MKNKNYTGQYSSITDFIVRNSLQKKAEKLFGKDFEPENDIENIQQLVGDKYVVKTIEQKTQRDKRADDYIDVIKLNRSSLNN